MRIAQIYANILHPEIGPELAVVYHRVCRENRMPSEIKVAIYTRLLVIISAQNSIRVVGYCVRVCENYQHFVEKSSQKMLSEKHTTNATDFNSNSQPKKARPHTHTLTHFAP